MTREEAIKIVRNIYQTDAEKEALGTLIPELRESEDERIYNEIMEFFKKNEKRCIVDNSYTRWISWLEKQKDANKAIEAVDRIDKYIDEHLANAHDMKDSNPDKKYYRGWDDALGKMSGILQDVYSGEKQKEQKKEELVYRLNGLMQDYIKEGKDDEEKEHRLKCYQLFWDALEDANFFGQKEQKPVERATMRDFNYHEGEPDEKAWSRLFAILNYAEATSDDTPGEEIQALTNWIEGKQKPAWSEEDEWIRKLLIWQVHRNIEDETNDLAQSVYDGIKGHDPDLEESIEDWKKCLAWLKSLPLRCPKSSDNWKPSEEQMEALENSTALTEEQGEALYSLVCDLKKLCQ